MFASFQNQARKNSSTVIAPDEALAAECLRWWNVALVREKFRLSGIAERLKADPGPDPLTSDIPDVDNMQGVSGQQATRPTDPYDDYE